MIGNEATVQKTAVAKSAWKVWISCVFAMGALNSQVFVFFGIAVGQIDIQREGDTNSEARDGDSLWTRKRGEDWPGFLGPGRDGESREVGIEKDWTDGNLKVLWNIETGQGYGAGAISAGRYFHFDRIDGFGRLRCFHAETGSLLWDYSYPSEYDDLYGYDSGPRASPIVEDGRVYIYGVEGQLFCLNSMNGKKVWSVDTAKKFGLIQNFFGVGSTPAISGDTLLVMVGGSGGLPGKVSPTEMPDVEPDGSALVGFDKLTGDVKFRTGDDLASYSSVKLAKFDGRDVALVWAREKLWGIDPLNGKSLFEFPWRARPLESVNASTPVVHGNQIFLSECYGPGGVLLNYEKEQLNEAWSDKSRREKSMAAHWNTPVLHNGYLYGSSGRNPGDAELRCVELATGKVAWSEQGLARSSVTLVDGHLLVLGEYGVLKLIEATPQKYNEISALGPDFEVKLKHPCWSAPIISHGLMIVHDKNQVVCFDLIPQK